MSSEEGLSRRDYLKSMGATGTAVYTAGCLGDLPFVSPEAGDLHNAVDSAQDAVRTEIPWEDYGLTFDVDSFYLELERIGPTGVEEAYNFAVGMEVDLTEDSDDISGWLSSEALAEEFWRLYAPPSYDMLLQTYDSLQAYTAPNQPSHRDRVVEYAIKIDAEQCSYVEDFISATDLDDILASPSAYLDYLNEGEAVNVVFNDGALGVGYFC